MSAAFTGHGLLERRSCRARTASGVVALIAIAATGCQPSEKADRALQARLGSLNYTLNRFAKSEQDRPAQLERDLNFAAREFSERPVTLNQNLTWFGQIAQDDVQRWESRQPLYWKKTGEIFWGRPERIENTAIILFW
jgi:hypothetical protein